MTRREALVSISAIAGHARFPGVLDAFARAQARPGIGATFKESRTRPGPWWVWMEGYGECLPRYENRVSLDYDKPDKWGMPTLDIDMAFGPNELTMRKDMEALSIEILEAAELQNVQGFTNPPHPGEVIHEMGTARWGSTRRNRS